jgi:hypothetical protein
MLQTPGGTGTAGVDLATRLKLALDRIHQLIVFSEVRAMRDWRNYHLAQGFTIGLAAITPCLIVLAKENPTSWLLNWLQLFFPAIAAIAAGLTHIFRWREDAIRHTTLAEAIRSLLWRYQTRAGDFSSSPGAGLTDEQALDRLVVKVDEVNLQSVARWSAAQATDSPTSNAPGRAATAGAEH